MADLDLTEYLQNQVQQAVSSGTGLRIVGGDSKKFYRSADPTVPSLHLAGHDGIIDYEPSELVVTARSGTRLEALVELLAQHRQMLAFEPPRFGETATLGGTLACGFSGPRRPFAGSARDFTLGCRIINGRGEILSFGGRVIKNVAGFDVSRLMVGALGTLGVLLDVSLKVLPLPESELTLQYELTAEQAQQLMTVWCGQPWPLSALAYDGEQLRVRLSGAADALTAVARQLGGEVDATGEQFWIALREQKLSFFQQPGNLWRISVAPATPRLPLSGEVLLDWGGALRWIKTDQPAALVHQVAAVAGGHAICFRGENVYDGMRLDPHLLALQQKIRQAFDPYGLLNPGCLFSTH